MNRRTLKIEFFCAHPRSPKFTICPFQPQNWPFQTPKTLSFTGKLDDGAANIAIKRGNSLRTNGPIFMRILGGTP